ncbi:MAG: DnaB-like helicase C-terminal domain-containing protein, partial [Cryomorphaceae bacterium]|nr:DnaB-like helicase C-terminal domain-containing protein [Cryomorphaceae bacterium]
RPQLSDLRESGAIEQDADIVSFIYRPEYYGLTDWEDGSPCDGQAELIISKHRNGSLDDIRLRFQGSLARFSDLDDSGGEMILQSKINEDQYNDDDDYGAGGGLPVGEDPLF